MGAPISKMDSWQFVDVFEEEVNRMKENAIPKGTKDAAKSGVTLFDGNLKMLLTVIKKTLQITVEMLWMSMA